MSKNKENSEKKEFSSKILIASSILLASIILAGGMIFSAGTVNSGLANLSITTSTGNSGGSANLGNLPSAPLPTQSPPSQGGTANLAELSKDGFIVGNANAPITIIEYSDFQCPFCGRFFSDTLPQVEKEYIDTGKVKFVYKHFPLRSIHPNAQKAGEAFECAVDQGKGREMHDAIFERQNEWASAGVLKIKEIAAGIVGDSATFDSCLDNGDKKTIVDSHYNQITTLGGTGTPSFFIGPSDGEGQLVVGAQPYSTFQSIVESLLS